MADNIIKEEILSFIDKASSYDVIVLKTVNSTNSYIKKLTKDDAPHETVVIADKQTEGRGRLGREFFSPEGTGIYMSILLKPDKISLNPSLLTVAAGVAVCRTIKSISKTPPAIKWVNDIFLSGKKVCGILAESTADSKTGTINNIIVGIGLNVTTPSSVFPGKLSDIAVSLFPENTIRNKIIANIIDEFKRIYDFCDKECLIEEYKSYSCVLGKKISFTKGGETFAGIATDINMEGNLIVKLENGKTITLKSGEVSLGSENFVG
ncbi:MAG: biotin--[Clostridia bacterium]|nr:biotin--[acetyl-CoA-carboxylase] ligase [Clostridia bacterium]